VSGRETTAPIGRTADSHLQRASHCYATNLRHRVLVLSDTSSRNYAPVSGHAFQACRTRYPLSSPRPLGPEG